MKAKRLFVLIPVLSVSLVGCGTPIKYAEHLDDYVFAMKYKKDFTILQLTDIHWNVNTSTYSSKRYLDKVFKEVQAHIKKADPNNKIDLVELTGDMFMLSNSSHVRSFINFMEEESEKYGNFQYAAIWGNHDRHGIYNPNWLAKQFANAKHCYYFETYDDLYGRSNFMINLTSDGSKTSEVKWQIANLDSGASFSDTSISPFRDYDYIRKDQTQWWLAQHKNNAPGIAYYHIPQDENDKMWAKYKANATSVKQMFFKLEDFAANESEEYASDFIDVAIENNLKGAFMGHAHNVDWTVEMTGNNGNKMLLGLGVKTGEELYYAHIDINTTDPDMKSGLNSLPNQINENFDLIGASLVTLTDAVDDIQGNFKLEHLYLNETTSGDKTWWEEWQ
ncbi:MAG: metallophosphoesterase [Bacilli bacterium]|nr:metallophosphoesterase [Bacilli bacterium]